MVIFAVFFGSLVLFLAVCGCLLVWVLKFLDIHPFSIFVEEDDIFEIIAQKAAEKNRLEQFKAARIMERFRDIVQPLLDKDGVQRFNNAIGMFQRAEATDLFEISLTINPKAFQRFDPDLQVQIKKIAKEIGASAKILRNCSRIYRFFSWLAASAR